MAVSDATQQRPRRRPPGRGPDADTPPRVDGAGPCGNVEVPPLTMRKSPWEWSHQRRSGLVANSPGWTRPSSARPSWCTGRGRVRTGGMCALPCRPSPPETSQPSCGTPCPGRGPPYPTGQRGRLPDRTGREGHPGPADGGPSHPGRAGVLDAVLDRGDIRPDLLTGDPLLQRRIAADPWLRWKADNVRAYRAAQGTP